MKRIVVIIASAAMLMLLFVMANADVAEEIERIQKMIAEKGLHWTAGHTSVADLTLEERQNLCGLIIPEDVKWRFAELDKLPLPELLNTEIYFDWRDLNGVTPVKNQANCGSCWDFAATGAFESAYMIEEGIEPDFSEQQVLSCNTGGGGCDGGWMEYAYDLFMDYGAIHEDDMPYEADDTVPCTQEEYEPIAHLLSYEDIPNNVSYIKNALMTGPLSTAFTVYDDFRYYTGGCYEHENTASVNHAVVIVGWDDSECDGYGAWIVKNSWGPGWGVDGYFYMKYGSSGFGEATQLPVYSDSGLPEAVFSSDPIEMNLLLGGEDNITFELSNIGDGDLVYVLGATSQTNQDSFGYYWYDSNSSEGPDYNWIDITSIGEAIQFPDDIDDGNSGPQAFGFNFEYYGETFSSINVCTNGWASFSDYSAVEWGNVGIPDPEPPNNMLAPFYDDLNLENGGDIYFYTNSSDTAIITWQEVPDWRQEGIFTFQIILTAPDNIVYQYASMGPGRMDECSIGMENGTGTVGLQVARDEDYVCNSLAISFTAGDAPVPPQLWLDVDPDNGIIEPGNSVDIDLTFSAGELPVGSYDGILRLMTNVDYSNITDIPITLNIDPLDIDIDTNVPSRFALQSVYPNPFNPVTTIKYSLSEPGMATLEAFNILGQKTATIFSGRQNAGEHSISWDASALSSGTYFVRLSCGEQVTETKVILLK